ncbi:MAG: response regulator [Nitrospinae bacterium]|nr:response regulator [Nitrospinota bacterium]
MEETILIVDDIKQNCEVIQILLESEGLNSVSCTRGKEAIKILAETYKEIKVILLDIQMPEMDGFETANRIKENENTKDIPIIFLSAHDDEANLLKAFDTGAVSFIAKPINSDLILRQIKTFIDLKNAQDQLKNINKTLEENVAERTKELEGKTVFLESILLAMDEMLFITDIKGHCQTINNSVSLYLEYGEDELINQHISKIFSDKNLWEEISSSLNNFVYITNKDVTFLTIDGKEVHVLLSVSMLYDPSSPNLVKELVFIAKNITELKAKETLLLEAQRLSHIGNWEWDITTNALHWSDEIYRIFGLEVKQFKATYDAFIESVHPDDREMVKESVNKALEKEQYNLEHRIVKPDGTIRIVHEKGGVNYDEKDKPIRMFGTVQDITERKEAELQIATQKESLEKIFASIPSPFVVLDKSLNVVKANPLFYSLQGKYCWLTPEVIYDAFQKAMDDESLQINIMSECVQVPELFITEPNVKEGKEPEKAIFSLVFSGIEDIEDAPLFNKSLNVIILTDITEQKEKEAILEHSLRLGALSEMATGIAHELNNPLQSIMLTLQSWQSIPNYPQEKMNKDYDDILGTVQHMATIIEQMRGMSRYNAVVKFKRVDIRKAIETVQVLMEAQLAHHKIELIFDVPDQPIYINGDINQLQQVMANLVNNAQQELISLKDVTRKIIKVSCQYDGNDVCIKVADTGRGIPEHVATKIFQPFFTTKPPGQGTGIGLSITRTIVEAHKGEIKLVKEEGFSTCFELCFKRNLKNNVVR